MSGPEQRLNRGHQPHLSKQHSWSPDTLRDEAWSNRRKNNRHRRGSSVTDDDLDELRACFELGFTFNSPDLDPKLSSTFPALEFYHAVNRRYSINTLSRSSSASFSDSDSASSSLEANGLIIDPSKNSSSLFLLDRINYDIFGKKLVYEFSIVTGEDPELVKTRLKQWAQVVACSVRQFPPN